MGPGENHQQNPRKENVAGVDQQAVLAQCAIAGIPGNPQHKQPVHEKEYRRNQHEEHTGQILQDPQLSIDGDFSHKQHHGDGKRSTRRPCTHPPGFCEQQPQGQEHGREKEAIPRCHQGFLEKAVQDGHIGQRLPVRGVDVDQVPHDIEPQAHFQREHHAALFIQEPHNDHAQHHGRKEPEVVIGAVEEEIPHPGENRLPGEPRRGVVPDGVGQVDHRPDQVDLADAPKVVLQLLPVFFCLAPADFPEEKVSGHDEEKRNREPAYNGDEILVEDR